MEVKPSTPSSSFTDASRYPRRLPSHPVLPAFQGHNKDSAQSVLRECTKQLQGMLPAVAAKPTHFQELRGQQHAGSVPKTRIRLWAVRTARAMLGSGESLHYHTCTPITCKTCTACVQGNYSVRAVPNEETETESSDSNSCTDCKTGSYSRAVGATAKSSCTACPIGSTSLGGSASLTACHCIAGWSRNL